MREREREINIHISSPLHRPLVTKVLLFLISSGFFCRNDGVAEPVFFICKLLLRPWDLSHRVER